MLEPGENNNDKTCALTSASFEVFRGEPQGCFEIVSIHPVQNNHTRPRATLQQPLPSKAFARSGNTTRRAFPLPVYLIIVSRRYLCRVLRASRVQDSRLEVPIPCMNAPCRTLPQRLHGTGPVFVCSLCRSLTPCICTRRCRLFDGSIAKDFFCFCFCSRAHADVVDTYRSSRVHL
jgi:hypothetical protein